MAVNFIRLVAFGLLLTIAGQKGWAMDTVVSEKVSAEFKQGLEAVRAGNYSTALPLLEKAVAENPKNANAWNYIGYSNRKLKRFDKAMTAYQKALALEPNHRAANEYIGELYLQTGKLAQAKARLKVLDAACFFGCEEYDELKAAIAAYEAKRKGS